MKNNKSEPIPVMDYRQYRRARRLVHECCNYIDGKVGTHSFVYKVVLHISETSRIKDMLGLLSLYFDKPCSHIGCCGNVTLQEALNKISAIKNFNKNPHVSSSLK